MGGRFLELRQLRTFRTVARLLSFNRAAERLHYAQSSISAQVLALEEELGVPLFNRLGRRIALTEAGETLLPYAERILDLSEEAGAEAASSKVPRGSLTIRIPESFGVLRLPPVIREYRNRFPEVELRLVTCAHEGLAKDLRRGITDLAFLLTESLSAADLEAETLGFEEIVLVAGPDHPLAARRTVKTRDLEGETVLLSRTDCSYRLTFQQILDREEVRAGAALEFHSVETLRRCLREGIGVSVLPEAAVREDVAAGRLTVLPWKEGKLEVALLMVWYRERWLSPALAAFMDLVRRVLAP